MLILRLLSHANEAAEYKRCCVHIKDVLRSGKLTDMVKDLRFNGQTQQIQILTTSGINIMPEGILAVGNGSDLERMVFIIGT